ncbi:winged helix-turn-helix transcriptional regulator [Ruegeria arenilitoris]|nr:winged helix-turn-helix transcriptional regulator [Ruegeria arenilitoris]
MDIKTLVNLTSRAWSLNILALLHSGVPGRQAPLLEATPASRTSFSASLDHLVQLKLIERNPGHGHPLRPEFRLTPAGREAAIVAHRIMAAVPDDKELALLRRNWTVPILALVKKPKRFSILKSDLAPITDRALSNSLHQLEDRNWVKREIELSARAPFPTYCAANKGADINHAIALRG